MFVYLHDLVNRYSTEDLQSGDPLTTNDSLYLSKDFAQLISELQATYIYAELKDHFSGMEIPSIIKFIDYFIPGHAFAIMSLILHSVPK